jgi:hypothetical protein
MIHRKRLVDLLPDLDDRVENVLWRKPTFETVAVNPTDDEPHPKGLWKMGYLTPKSRVNEVSVQ